jgi:uncharacterized membrane protein YeaQ/YmgE (transglycosylase-associated protein family)
MSRENKILLWCLVGGVGLVCLSAGEWFFGEFFDHYREGDNAKMFLGTIGAVLLVACFVLREVFRGRMK